MPIISSLIKGVGSGIGLAAEAIQDRKERKAAARGISPNPQTESSVSRSISKQEEANLHGHDHDRDHDNDTSSSDEEELDSDKAAWALDAATDIDNDTDAPPVYTESEASLDQIDAKPMEDYARDFMHLHPQPSHPPAPQRLPMPVILPQRRPKDKSRGFVRAYAPLLDQSGIDEKTFIDFLNALDDSAKNSPIFSVINLACFAIGFIPSPIAMGVTIAVQTVSRTAQEIQSRTRRNTFLDAINAELFMPKGLYAMIMTFKPDSPFDPVLQSNILTEGTSAALVKATSHPDSDLRAKLKSMRLASGVTKGELSLPESAPLVYPALDAAAAAATTAATSNDQQAQHEQSALKSSSAFVAGYLDRRAQATYAGMHPHSALAHAAPPPEKAFANRYADPNHPANSGSLSALLTGGHVDLSAGKRERRARRRARKDGRALSADEIGNARMGRAPVRRRPGVIRRVLTKDVLYLIVCALPSEAEMREIMGELERSRSGSQGVGPGMGEGRYGAGGGAGRQASYRG